MEERLLPGIPMKVAVTGGAGFVGSHVVDRLVAAGHEVVVLDLRRPHRDDVGFQPTDILDVDALMRGLRGCDVVFHLAAMANVNEAAADPVRTADLNVAGTLRVWEAARISGVPRAILASTVWVYDGAAGEGPVDEQTPFDLSRAGHVYTSSKIAAELMVHSHHHLYGQEFVILRYGIPFGPRMRDELVIPRFVKAALAGEAITVHGDGSQYRNYVYIDDLADAHVLALGPAAANETFNLEGAERVTIRDLVESITALVPRDVPVEFGDARAGDYVGREVSADRARDILGWEPKVPFAEGLRRYVDWYIERESRPSESAVEVPIARSRSQPAIGAAALATLVLPVLAVDGRSPSSFVVRAAAAVCAAGAAWAVGRLAPRRGAAIAGAAIAASCFWLLSQVAGPLVDAVSFVLGGAIGLSVSLPSLPSSSRDRTTVGLVVVTGAGLGLLHAVGQSALALWLGAGLVMLGARGSHASRRVDLGDTRRPGAPMPHEPGRESNAI
jgi:UDP-glucose 4-epimerase